MERRLLTFFIAWTALFIIFTALRPKPAPQVDPAANVAEVEPAIENAADPKPPPADGDPTAAEDSEDSEAVQRPEQPQLVTLGSMDPAAGYAMLVTLNSRGGGIERIELTDTNAQGKLKYRRVDVRHGYLGYLGTRDSLDQNAAIASGAEVSVVGPGTPADRAGLQIGDVIRTINGIAVDEEDSIGAVLLKTEPGDVATIVADRGGKSITLKATLTEHPLDLVRLATTAGVDQVVGNETRLSCLMTLSALNGSKMPLIDRRMPGVADPSMLNWEIADAEINTGNGAIKPIANGDTRVSMRCPLAVGDTGPRGLGGVTLQRSYTLHKGSYVIDMNFDVHNDGDEKQNLGYRLEGPNGVTMEGWWYSNKITPNFLGGAAARDVIYDLASDGGPNLVSGFNLLKRAKNDKASPDEPILAGATAEQTADLNYVGVDAQYFLVSYMPAEGATSIDQYRRLSATVASRPDDIPRHKERAVNSSFYLDSDITPLEGGESIHHELRLYAGPKDPDVLETYGLGGSVYYGWFAPFARFLANILHFFSGIGNYALAIILLTVMVRGLMFPLSRKAAVNAQRMQELAPELKKVSEQYKDDMEGRLRATQALQKKAGFNPLAGCLPMFVQLPIFIGLYRALSVDIELRQQPMIPGVEWASNLAGPDMMFFWGETMPDMLAGRGTGWLGPYFNILPIIVVVLFLAQQKLFMPPATDDQTRMTQKMMNVMTLMMGLFFFKVPAGLCVYFITSSLWGIAERIFVKKTLPPKGSVTAALAVDGAPPPTKSKTIADKLRDRIQPPAPTFSPPNKRKRPGKR